MSDLNKPGLHAMDWPTYYAHPAANFSLLKLFKKSALHAYEEMNHPKEQTPSLLLGQAIHAAILEPGDFDQQYIGKIKVDRRTKVGKAAWAEFESKHADKIILPADDFDKCREIRETVWQHEAVKAILGGKGLNERSGVWKDDEYGVWCKCRFDRLTEHDSIPTIVDLKTTQDASPWAFQRAVANYGYAAQAAMYLDGAEAIAPVQRRHLLIAVEKERPYAIGVYELTEAALEQGRLEYRDWLRRYAHAMETGAWPGYPMDVQPLDLPKWAMEMVYE